MIYKGIVYFMKGKNMPERNPVYTYDANTLDTLIRAQSGVRQKYDPNETFGSFARSVENQSAIFLEDYIHGEVKLTPEAAEMMPDFFTILRQSGYGRIHKLLKKAETAYKEEIILRHKEEEKKKRFADTDCEILNNKKKAAQLSSKDMLLIASLLKDIKNSSTKKKEDKLKGFAMNKIERTLKGEIPADEDFDTLTKMFGTYRQKTQVQNRIAQGTLNTDASQKKNATKETTDKRANNKTKQHRSGHSHFWKKLWKATKRTTIVAGLALLGYVGIKSVHSEMNKSSSDTPKSPKTEVVSKTSQTTKNTQKEVKTADFSKEQSALNKAYKNRFDTALEIILGKEARDNLYKQIDALEKSGKIEYKDGTTREWYAHAFTMYAKITPNSKENKAIKDFLAGKNNDKDYINSLVVKAGRTGSGVKGSGKYSSFDKAPTELQQKYKQAVRQAKMAQAKVQASR